MKILGWSLAALAGVVVIALAAVALIVDGGFVKSRLERAMQEKQRTLVIEGEPKLRLFPVAALSLGRTTLSEPSSKDLFLQLESANVAVRMLPLLSGALVVDTLEAKNVQVNVRRLRDGRMNYDDLLDDEKRREAAKKGDEKAPAAREERRDPPRLVVGKVDIEGARVSYADEASGQQVQVQDFNFKLAQLSDAGPSPLTLNASITGRNPEVNLKAQARGEVKLDLAKESVTFSKLDARLNGTAAKARALDVRVGGDFMADARRGLLEVNGLQLDAKGTLDRDAMSATLSAPKVSVTPDKATGSAITGVLRLAGPERKVEAKLDVAAAEGNATSLSIPRIALQVEAIADGGVLRANVNTPLRANLKQKSWELPKLAADITLTHPKLPQKTVRLPIEASVKADHERQNLAMNAAANAEELDFRLQLNARRFAPLDATFDLDSKRMNIDRYPFLLGGTGGARKSDDGIDLSGLAGPSVQGKIKVGSLQANNLKLADVNAQVKLARGVLEVSPMSARLYEGKLDGSVTANARGNQVAVKQSLQGVQINPLLKDLAQKDILEGKGDVSIDVTGAGATVPALKRSLNGNAKLLLKDGAYKGINLAEVFRKARVALGSRSEQAAAAASGGGAQKTDFTELSASFVIRAGVARSEDLTMRSPFLRVGGAGSFDIAAATLDYNLKPTLVSTSTGQQGRDDASGLTIPVRIHGPLDALRYEVDTRGLVTDAVKDRLNERIKERLGERLGRPADKAAEPGAQTAPQSPQDQLRDQVRDRLKGILGR